MSSFSKSASYQQNLRDFKDIPELHADTLRREQRYERIQEKLNQIQIIRERMFKARFSNKNSDSIKSTLTTLFNELKQKENELNHLREHDSKRFLESMQLQSLGIEQPTTLLVERGNPSHLHQQYEYMRQMDCAPPTTNASDERALNPQDEFQSSGRQVFSLTEGSTGHTSSAWRKVLNGVQASTRFMRALNSQRSGRNNRALSFIQKDCTHREDGTRVTKEELRENIDEVRALISELKGKRQESNTERLMVEQLQQKLREMDAAYSDLILKQTESFSGDAQGISAY